MVGVLKVAAVSQERHRCLFASKTSHHSAISSISISPPSSTKPRSHEIARRSTEIVGAYFCLHRRVVLIQEMSTLPGIALNGSNGAKRCHAVHKCSSSHPTAIQPTHLTPPAAEHILGPSESYRMVRRSVLDLIFILDYDPEVPEASR